MEAVYKYYKPAWRSFYKDFLLMLLVLVAAGAVNYYKPEASWLKWVWIAAAIVDVILLLYIAVRRSMISLILRDDPNSPSNQEIAFVTCNPLKPLSSEFRKSVEIGFTNIMHIEVGQTMMQTLFGLGNIIITSSGTGGEEIVAKNIPNPQAVRDEIQTHARKYKPSAHPTPTATTPEA